MSGERIALFDLCDTLISENTTLGFLRAFYGSNARFRRREWLVTSRASPLFYLGAAAMRWLKRDWARAWLVGSLRGVRRADLDAAARRYVADALGTKTNAPLIAALEGHRAAGDRIILVSSSLEPVVAAMAERLQVEQRSSRLDFAGDRCTGRIADDLTGRKVAVLADVIGQGRPVHVYTDNQSDAALVALADEATLVIPRGRSGRWAEGTGHAIIRL